MSLDFASNIVAPERVRCIGVEMRPYALGHHLRLIAEGSPFVTGQGFPGYDDLIAAAFICAHSWDELEGMGWFRKWIRLKLWGKLAGNFDVLESVVAMKLHVSRAMEMPETKRERGAKTVYLFSKWETRVYQFLRASGYGHSEAMDTPLVIANLMFYAHLEADGKMRFKSQMDYDMDDALTRACEQAEHEDGEKALPA